MEGLLSILVLIILLIIWKRQQRREWWAKYGFPRQLQAEREEKEIERQRQKEEVDRQAEEAKRQKEEIDRQNAEAEKLLDQEKLKNADRDTLIKYLKKELGKKKSSRCYCTKLIKSKRTGKRIPVEVPIFKAIVEYLKIEDLTTDNDICYIKLNFGKEFPYNDIVFPYLVDIIYYIFDISSKINIIVISGYHAFINSKGWEENLCFISVKVNKEEAYALKRENLTAEKILDNFDTRHGYEKDKKDQIVRVTAIYSYEDLEKMSYPTNQEEKEVATFDIIENISPEQFEQLISLLLKKMNFIVEHLGQTGDGGIDIEAQNLSPITGGKYIIQCKRYSVDNKVDVKDIRDLFGVIHSEMANKGILITTSDFTNKAVDFAKGKPIELIDGEKLKKLLAQFLPGLFKK